MLVGLFSKFPYSYIAVVYIINKGYLSCTFDLLVLGILLLIYGSFSESHELVSLRMNQLLASGDVNIQSNVAKLRTYMTLSLVANGLVVILTLFLFWPAEQLLLFLLVFKVSVCRPV